MPASGIFFLIEGPLQRDSITAACRVSADGRLARWRPFGAIRPLLVIGRRLVAFGEL
jgi:hypothetical protein